MLTRFSPFTAASTTFSWPLWAEGRGLPEWLHQTQFSDPVGSRPSTPGISLHLYRMCKKGSNALQEKFHRNSRAACCRQAKAVKNSRTVAKWLGFVPMSGNVCSDAALLSVNCQKKAVFQDLEADFKTSGVHTCMSVLSYFIKFKSFRA